MAKYIFWLNENTGTAPSDAINQKDAVEAKLSADLNDKITELTATNLTPYYVESGKWVGNRRHYFMCDVP